MMQLSSPELGILSRVIRPESADLSPAAAKALLKLGFAEADRARMRELLAKNQADLLTEKEREEEEGYEIVGHFIDLIHSKARRSIKKSARKG